MHEDRTCGCCGDAALDVYGFHSHVCAGGHATRGHNVIRDEVLDLAIKADAAAESEPVSLISSRPGLRPADILTAGAIQGTLAALDVGVTAPSAADGDRDSTELYRDVKISKYRRYFDGLAAQGIQYKPIIWSAWGRPHVDATAVLKALGARAARRRGLTSGSALCRQASVNISLAIQKRSAQMALACMGTGECEEDEAVT